MNDAARFKERAENDTGFFCRRVLGNNYDLAFVTGADGKKRQERVNVGVGGVRDSGQHKSLVEFIDKPTTKIKVIITPRGSYKSTILVGYVMRRALKDRTLRFAYGMHTDAAALNKLHAIKQSFATNEVIRKVWGNVRGKPWRSGGFTLAGSPPELQDPTFRAFGVDKQITGGHPDVIVADDLVHEKNVKNEGIAKINETFSMLIPLLNPGGTLIDCGTPYAVGDLHDWLQTELFDQCDVFLCDAGVTVEERASDGKRVVVGTPSFPHLSLEVLQDKLETFKPFERFSSQYLCKLSSGLHQPFRREHFRESKLSRDMLSRMTGYLFTDLASSRKTTACHTVIAYGAFDDLDNFFLLDMRVGHFSNQQTIDQFFDVLCKWSSLCYHRGELLETTDANSRWLSQVENEAHARRMRLKIIHVRRNARDESKNDRIASLQGRLQDGRFYVNVTLPRTFTDASGEQVLYNPDGVLDPATKRWQASGFLVDSFIRFPLWNRKDVPDALADMDRPGPDHIRYAYYCTPSRLLVPKTPSEIAKIEERKIKRGQPWRGDTKPAGSWLDRLDDRRKAQ